MDEKQCDDMLDRWADEERAAAPRLRPTRDLYARLKANRRVSWYPVMARWATVGAAAIALVVVLHPSLVPRPLRQRETNAPDVIETTAGSRETRRNVERDGLEQAQDMARGDARERATEKAFAPQKPPALAEEENQLAVTPADATDARSGKPESAAEPPVPALAEDMDAAWPAQPQPRTRQQARSLADNEAELARDSSVSGPPKAMLAADNDKGAEMAERQQPQASRVSGDRLEPAVGCTPLPGGTAASTDDAATLSHPMPSQAEPEEAESGLLGLSQTQPASRLCTVHTAEKIIGAKTFHLQGDTWFDRDYVDTQPHLIIQRDSRASTQLLEILPGLAVYADSGEHLLVSVGGVAIELAPDGQTELAEDDVRLLQSIPAKALE